MAGGDNDDKGSDDPASWVDRHLVKIVVAAAVICAMGLFGRAFMG